MPKPIDLSGYFTSGQRWSLQNRPMGMTSMGLYYPFGRGLGESILVRQFRWLASHPPRLLESHVCFLGEGVVYALPA